jgi:predicted O-methyltransferase YrrM
MGVSAAWIASAIAPNGRLWCVDPYYNGEALRMISERHLRRQGVIDKICYVRKSSEEALAYIPKEADFMFVDGDHSWQGIETDWRIVEQCLAPGGIACFHDTSPPPETPNDRCDSVRFFDEIIRKDLRFEHLEVCRTLNVIRRRLNSSE